MIYIIYHYRKKYLCSHKIVCQERLQDLEVADIVDDISSYKLFASSGQNPKNL